MSINNNVSRGSLALVAALALAGCGGGGGSADAGGAPQAADGSPAAANAAAVVQAFTAFQASLPPPEVIDPATLQKALPAPDDTAEPTPIT